MVFLIQMVLVFTRTLGQERWPIERCPRNRGVAIAESALPAAASEKDRKVVHAIGK